MTTASEQPTATRRTIDLPDLDAVLDDVHQLLANGYVAVGQWNLSQVCRHVGYAMTSSLDGFAVQSSWFQRTMAKLMKKRFFRTRSIPTGLPAPSGSTFEPGEDAEAVAEFVKIVERFRNHTGPKHPHPFFGELTDQEWIDFHTIHAAHHLSFLVPREA